MKTPYFSVIVPAHNAEDRMRKGLDTIRGQTFRDFELIIVCDDCQDNTAEIAREYTERVYEVGWHSCGKTRNKGLDEARGEWILFMDDDDWWLHEYVLQQLSDKIDEYEADIICFSFVFRHIGYARPVRRCNGRHWIAAWCKCYKRASIRDARFSAVTDGSADVQFYAMMFDGSRRVYDWDMPMYYYNYWREDSISERCTHDFRGRRDLL